VVSGDHPQEPSSISNPPPISICSQAAIHQAAMAVKAAIVILSKAKDPLLPF
jgi:hypothetical protein